MQLKKFRFKNQTNHTIRWSNFEIITTNRRYYRRLFVEACTSGDSVHAPLNRDDGGLLPDTYLHFISKNKRWLVSVQEKYGNKCSSLQIKTLDRDGEIVLRKMDLNRNLLSCINFEPE